MMMPPKINLLYYKHILDDAIERFAKDFNDEFVKNANNYVYSKNAGKKLLKIFREYVIDDIKRNTEEFNVLAPNYYFIIGSCYPKDNVLNKYVNKSDITPEMSGNIKYFLSEDDIKVDDILFNSIFETISEEILDRKKLKKMIGDRYKNIFFLWFDDMDCYFTYRMIKDIYGKTNTVNLSKVRKIPCNLRSINNYIDSKVENIKSIIRSDEMNFRKCEIRQMIELCMGGMV